jgi:hypothetical protein
MRVDMIDDTLRRRTFFYRSPLLICGKFFALFFFREPEFI